MSRRELLGAGLAAGAVTGGGRAAEGETMSPALQAFELMEATFDALQEGMRSGKWTSARS